MSADLGGEPLKLIRLSLALSVLLAAACDSGEAGKSGNNGTDGKPGEPGTEGTTPEATKAAMTVNHITPRAGLLDRTLEVVISFDGPRADLAKAKLDFGDGVEVEDSKVVNGTIVATLLIAPDAKLGAHDVKVTLSAGDPIVATKAFHVAVPIDAKVGAGKAEQGGLVRIDVTNKDKVWFDTENFLLLPMVDQKTPSLVPLANQGFTATDGSVVLLGDPLAKTGAIGFLGINNPNDPDSVSYLSDLSAANITARSPEALVAGTPLEKIFASELETGFYSADFAPQAANEGLLVDVLATVPEGSTAKPMILAYPASGAVADLLDQKVEDPGFPMFGIPATQAHVTYPVAAATKGFFIVMDADLGHGPSTKVSLNYTTIRAQIFKEKTTVAHDTAETGQSMGSLPGFTTTIPGRILTGELSAAGENDFYKFTGLSASNPTDMQLSLTSDADVLVRVDTVPTFDSENLLEVVQTGRAGSGFTASMKGATRYIQVTALPDGSKQTGKYTLGMKRIASPTN
jgi:hypothetical protein